MPRANPETRPAGLPAVAMPVVNQITESKMLHLSHAPTDAPKRAAAAPKQTAGELFSKSINLSGRRRFTSQRLVLYALLASQGREGALATAHDALAIFRDAHAALLDGELSPKLMGGELKVWSRPGQGTKVIVTIPDRTEE